MTDPMQATPQRVPELDGVRGVAILLVLLWHYVVVAVPLDSGPLALPLHLVLNAS